MSQSKVDLITFRVACYAIKAFALCHEESEDGYSFGGGIVSKYLESEKNRIWVPEMRSLG